MAITIASPAPPVERTDNFEQQRVKINNLAAAFTSSKQMTWLTQPKIIWIGNYGNDGGTFPNNDTVGALRGQVNGSAGGSGFSGQTGYGNFTIASNAYDWRSGNNGIYDSTINLTTTLGVTPTAVELYYVGYNDTDDTSGNAVYIINSSTTIIKLSHENAGGIISRNLNFPTPDGNIRVYRFGDADRLGSILAVTAYYV